jgi:prepilin-type N-terminal cleavage/methylation domain-containing protein
MNNQIYRLAIASSATNKRTDRAAKDQEAGFSLIESLVAAVVVGILIVGIAPMVALSTSARVNARRVDQATQAARSYIDAVRGGVIDVKNFPDNLVLPPIDANKNDQGQYVFEDILRPDYGIAAIRPEAAQAFLALNSTQVRGINFDANGNGFRTDDPQDLVIQPMRSGPLGSSGTVKTDLERQGFWLAVRVYRADSFNGVNVPKKGTEPECAQTKLPFSSGSSSVCPIVTMRSQILSSVNSNNLEDIKLGIGKK